MKKILVLLTLLVFSGAAFAANQANTGCGLGTMLLGNNDDSKLMQLSITSTNQTLTNQSTGITSEIESFGCSGTRKWASNEVSDFVQGNMDNLIRDVAAGSGETIDALAGMMDVADVDAFGSKLQQNFSVIFPTTDVEYAYVADAIVVVSNS